MGLARLLENSDRFHKPTCTTNLCNGDAVCFLRDIQILLKHYLGELRASNGQFTLYYRRLTVAMLSGHSSGRSNIHEGSLKWRLTHYLHQGNSAVCHLVQGMSNAMSNFTAQIPTRTDYFVTVNQNCSEALKRQSGVSLMSRVVQIAQKLCDNWIQTKTFVCYYHKTCEVLQYCLCDQFDDR